MYRCHLKLVVFCLLGDSEVGRSQGHREEGEGAGSRRDADEVN